MPHHETFHETHDGKKLYLQAWEPEKDRKAAILLVHGVGEHSGRYAHFAQKMNENGYAVYTFDGRGHGKSSLPKPTAYIENLEDYIKDTDTLYKKMKSYVGDIPCFIYGHSMGGGIVTYYALTYQPEVTGILLSGALLLPGDDVSPLLIKISSILSRITPKLPALKVDSTHLSHDPELMVKYDTDPLVYRKGIPARTGAELLKMIRSIGQDVHQFNYPVLIMHGTDDRLTNLEGSKMLYEKAASSDKTLKLYEGLYHEIINEVEKEMVMEDMIGWIEERIK